MDEDGERFKTLDEAKEYLIVEFNEYVARNLDEVQMKDKRKLYNYPDDEIEEDFLEW